jgi:hypothetical protein
MWLKPHTGMYKTVTWSYLHTDRWCTGHRQKYVRSVLFCELGIECLNLFRRLPHFSGLTMWVNWYSEWHYFSSVEHIQYVIFPWTCYKTHPDLNMDDVALCHIIIIIITLSRWSRNTLSTQSIPSCTTHSVKLNTGTGPNTGYSRQHHARVKHTSAELHYIQWTQ